MAHPLVSITATTPCPPRRSSPAGTRTSRPGSYFKCDTLEELCEKLGLPVEQTVATVERYNELCDGGRDLDFFKKAKYMVRIDPPYYGAWNTLPQFFTVHGGPAHEHTNMQVCDENDEAIPGLYNVGTMVGDFFSNIYTFRIQGQSLRLVPDLRLPHRQVHRRERVALGLALSGW